MSFYQSIAGKYFINSLAAGLHAKALMRGRILGPVANELSTFYLCEIFPAESDKVAITTETILPVEQLVGVYFYETRPLLDAAWDQAMRTAQAQLAAVKRQRQQTIKSIEAKFIKALKAQGISVVDASSVQHAAVSTALMLAVEDGGSVGEGEADQ